MAAKKKIVASEIVKKSPSKRREPPRWKVDMAHWLYRIAKQFRETGDFTTYRQAVRHWKNQKAELDEIRGGAKLGTGKKKVLT